MSKLKSDHEQTLRMRRQLLAWYARNQRDLPWRHNIDPYSVWVSEIMLQQTRVAVVIDRHQAFLTRFPTLASLAQAEEQQVLALWSGLGYYRRARMLHKAAQFVVQNLNCKLPVTSAELCQLPGIGAYTAAAIASIAHDEPIAAVDGNVERVICRLQGWEADDRAGKAQLKRKITARANELVSPAHPGDFNQAMMELGATVCVPRNPQCLACPLTVHCITQGEHKTVSRAPMQSREAAYALVTRVKQRRGSIHEEVLLNQRPTHLSVMPGLWELPTLRLTAVPAPDLRMTVRHAIMQINYLVHIRAVTEDEVEALTLPAVQRRWVPLDQAAAMALTGLARKVLKCAHLLPVAPPAAR
jgi:A/G-specific adenine glycosylase